MSVFGDYKLYRKYEPAYADWKNMRDIQDAKRMAYLKKHPELKNENDIVRGKTLIRAIDVMDEYSQKRAENMELATDQIKVLITELTLFAGAGLGYLASKMGPVKKFLEKKLSQGDMRFASLLPVLIGALIGAVTAYPIETWSAKKQIKASREGRLEAMNNELKNPNVFAILTPEQQKQAEEISKTLPVKEETKKMLKLGEVISTIKSLSGNDAKYREQKAIFDKNLKEEEKRINDKMSADEILNSKKDQQLLTKMVEKIDISSQDYAENVELMTDVGTTVIMSGGVLFSMLLGKLLNSLKVKSAQKVTTISYIASLLTGLTFATVGTQLQKEASRVGRYKIKQELMKEPDSLVYVDDDKAKGEKEFVLNENKRNFAKFIKEAWKNNKEYKQYKKTTQKEEQKYYRAVEKLKLSESQINEAKRLQKNTFKTFNKIDENSQKYSESVEALGQSLMQPISMAGTVVGMFFALPLLFKKSANKVETAEKYAKYFCVSLLGSVPALLFNAYITKEQKKASRVADMMAINELNDYRQFK